MSKHSRGWMLTLLTFINLFNYLDRYILAALLPAIKRDTQWSDLSLGFLATAFMFSYFLISPLFGWLGDYWKRQRVMAFGVAFWSLAAAASGLARSYGALLCTRLGVGVGEASYATISPAVLSDLYPKAERGKAFAIFFMAIPVGSALGYLLGGLLEAKIGWRNAFFFTGAPGLLLALTLYFTRDPERGAFDEEQKQESYSLPSAYKYLAQNSSYVFTVLGYCAYTFVVGGIAVWIPSYMERYLQVTAAKGNIVFGAITVIAGFAGTLVGGSWADSWAKKSGDAYLKLSALSLFLALPVYILILQIHSFLFFACLLFVLEFLLFLSTSPVNAQLVNCVPAGMRATAGAVAIFMIHLFGDVISPPLIGVVSDHSSLQLGMWIFCGGILLSGLFWFLKVLFYFELQAWPQGAMQLPRAQCHRGYRGGGAQENTLEAFRAARAAGAVMVELDVRLARDGIPVVIHDVDILRVSGKQGVVAESSAAELKRLANAPSLAEVLQDPESVAHINIELKSESAANHGLELAVARVVQDCKAEHRVMFSSFNPVVLRRLSKLLPELPRALLVTEEKDPKNKFYLRMMLLAFWARPHMLNLDQDMYTEQFARRLQERKIPVSIWTVQKQEQAKKLLELGAESIISDDPRILA